MPPKKKCWTKPKKDGGTYTTCKEGQDKPKKTEEPKKKIKFKVSDKPKQHFKTGPDGKLIKIDPPKKEEPKKKRVFHVKEKAKAKPANKPQHAKVIEPKKRVANVAKVIPATVKPKQSIGKSLTGLSHEQMNKLSPLELFGMLPVGVSKGVVLNPKATGVKVAQDPMRKRYNEDKHRSGTFEEYKEYHERYDEIQKMYDSGKLGKVKTKHGNRKDSSAFGKFHGMIINIDKDIKQDKLEGKTTRSYRTPVQFKKKYGGHLFH